ncbi:MAG: right-handed parallel beta-helix repeat-containing protein, partial [Clostridia bacterium]|nr:right-handed parallel beta-helix repeat-containing protein [Clostridia bacterium]
FKSSPLYVTFKIDETSNYKEENGEYFWYGTDYKLGFTEHKNTGGWIPTAKPSNYNHVTKNGAHPFFGVSSIKEIAPRIFKARYIVPKDFEVGQVFYVFPKVRKNVGIFVDGSKNIRLENVTQRFNYSLAFVAQNSENIYLDKIDFSPRDGTEVDFSSLADFVHVCMCRGTVSVKNSNFNSSSDDCCNVHGIYFKIAESEGDTITVNFPHKRTFGFNPLRVNDTIAFIEPKTLAELGTSKILQSEMIDKYNIRLKLSTRNNPVTVGTVLEDVSACPDFEFSENTINRVASRGVLATTRGRILIENNKFLNTGLSGIHISNDALTWFESGAVKSAMIRGNAFMNCEENAILILPENRRFSSYVHENVFIDNNLFVLNGIPALNVNSTRNVRMRDNVYRGKPSFGKYVISKNTEGLETDCP